MKVLRDHLVFQLLCNLWRLLLFIHLFLAVQRDWLTFLYFTKKMRRPKSGCINLVAPHMLLFTIIYQKNFTKVYKVDCRKWSIPLCDGWSKVSFFFFLLMQTRYQPTNNKLSPTATHIPAMAPGETPASTDDNHYEVAQTLGFRDAKQPKILECRKTGD